jgi:hypothetical protein
MQRIIQSQTHSKTQDMQRDYYLNQKKTLEVSFTYRTVSWIRSDPEVRDLLAWSAVLWICDIRYRTILVRIRMQIRILGSVPYLCLTDPDEDPRGPKNVRIIRIRMRIRIHNTAGQIMIRNVRYPDPVSNPAR